MKIIVFSDLHYYCGDTETAKFNTSHKLVRYAEPLLDRLIDIANDKVSADLCINLGDLIQDDNDKQRDLEAFSYIHQQLIRFNCPCWSILGNHDLKMLDDIREIESILGYSSTHSFDCDGYHLVFLSPEIRSELGTGRGGCYKAQYLADKTIEWLKKDLHDNQLPAVVFTHYGIAEDATIAKEHMFMKNRTEVKQILREDPNILAVFSGHQHLSRHHVEDGVHYYVLDSMTSCLDGSGIPSGEYAELTLEDRTITVDIQKILLEKDA